MLESTERPDLTGEVNEVATEIGDYAIIGDCRAAALVSSAGAIDWLCLPHFSGASVFAALLDVERAGTFFIRPNEPFRTSRRYIGSAPVLETRFQAAAGTVRLTDLMPIVEDAGALSPMREILRIAEGLEGEVDLVVRFEPRPNYARVKPRLRARRDLGWACSWSDEFFLLTSSAIEAHRRRHGGHWAHPHSGGRQGLFLA